MIEFTPTTPLPRWNFIKADWNKFKSESAKMWERLPSPDIDINESYTTFVVEVIKVAKATIPRGYRNPYIPGWDSTCQQLVNAHAKAVTVNDKQSTAENLLNHLNNKLKKSWIEATESIDMKHSSIKA